MPLPPSRKPAFTLIELLVVIAVIGLLVALLLPALQAVRNAARASICRSNLKQICLAALNYEGAKRRLPPSRNGAGGWSAQAVLTPFLEQGRVYAAIDFSLSYKDPSSVLNGQKISGIRIPIYTCPEEPNRQVRMTGDGPFMPINYAVNMGTWFVWDPVEKRGGDGVFYPERGVRLREVTDGLSRTMLAAEVKTYQPYYRNAAQAAASLPLPTDPASVCGYGGEFKANTGHTEWVDGRVHQTGFTTTFAPNTELLCNGGYDVDFNNWQEGKIPNATDAFTFAAVTARSHHPGVVHAVMLDSSVHPIRDEVDLAIWQGLSTGDADDESALLIP
ncbi:MAG: DUF1559 domain-containing protein [Planctomycetales bacterium]|nr:DUF1559 domain-containing protein [Planctomycetales bacterium]